MRKTTLEKFMALRFPALEQPQTQIEFCCATKNCGSLKCRNCGYHASNKEQFKLWRAKQEQIMRAAAMIVEQQK